MRYPSMQTFSRALLAAAASTGALCAQFPGDVFFREPAVTAAGGANGTAAGAPPAVWAAANGQPAAAVRVAASGAGVVIGGRVRARSGGIGRGGSSSRRARSTGTMPP